MEELKKTENKQAWWQPALQFFAQIAGWIVFPILAAIFLGSWLDQRWGTGQKWYFILISVSFVLTIIGLLINTRKALKNMEEAGKKDSKKPANTDSK